MHLLNDILDTFFPKFCPSCGKKLQEGEVICADCLSDVEQISPKMELSVQSKWFFDEMFYRAPYKSVVGSIVRAYKYTPRPSLGDFLSDLFLEMFEQFPPSSNYCLTYVPITFKSLKEKGFDHMKKISQLLSKKARTPSLELLEVVKQKDHQVGLSPTKRRLNVVSKYDVLKENLYKTSGNIVLIDDVFTTGASVNECSKILKSCGASTVWVYTLAKTQKKGS